MISFLDKQLNIDKTKKFIGLTMDTNMMIIARLFEKTNNDIIVVANSLFDSNKIYEIMKNIVNETNVFPMDDFISMVAISASPELKIKRLETIRATNNPQKKIIITNLMGYLHLLPSKNKSNESLSFSVGKTIERTQLLETLDKFGYTRSSLVTTTGEFAERGFIVDVFGIEEKSPIRIEFLGDEIESIRTFDDVTQLSIEKINNFVLYPFKEQESDEKTTISDYLNNPITIVINKNQIEKAYKKLLEEVENFKNKKNISSDHNYFNQLKFPQNIIDIDTINFDDNKITNQEISNFNTKVDQLNEYIFKNIKNKKTILMYLSNKSQIDFIQSNIDNTKIIKDENDIDKTKLNIINRKINKGFILNDYIIIGEKDFESSVSEKINYQSSLKIGKRISSFDQINIGDYVVHRIHGIGIYNGIVTIEQDHLLMDYIQILYKGQDKVYIPIEKINTLYKYTVKDGRMPTINKLNSKEWERKKLSAKHKIDDITDELIELYAKRNSSFKKPYFSNEEEAKFASEFIYEPTPDQLKAIEEIENDLLSTKPMDRLLCGDVGYGKTEVAFRTIFKSIINGYQVIYLCPTTILSNQQYLNAMERFKNYPINIALLNRFTPTSKVKEIYEGLENHQIDLVIGTHKLLNDKIKYKNLNLLIVDEEQKFGVLHKEKIKTLKQNINILTLSATPIPRTLKMAMSGVRDLSIIDTPPVNRYPVQTYVIEEEDLVIKDVIYKELARNGQSFILYNKVASIEEKTKKISLLVPEARIVFAHGQMDKNELEKIMNDFVAGEYDVLVCTTIIESGIDIQNVNTLVILDAEQFGLSQLYQIRGRVGRSNRIAYAYLMYNRDKILTDTAIKRLNSIKEFTELGSGYKIAKRDLAIRGAGDMLGSEQAGFIDSIGIELYMEMINEKMQEISGEKIEDKEDNKNLINVQTHISDYFAKDETIKIEVHKRINEITSKEKLKIVESELTDRFGTLNENILIYMYQRLFEELSRQNNITQLNKTENIIEIIIPKEEVIYIDGNILLNEITKIDKNILIKHHNNRIIITVIISKLNKHFIYYLVKIMEVIKLSKKGQ